MSTPNFPFPELITECTPLASRGHVYLTMNGTQCHLYLPEIYLLDQVFLPPGEESCKLQDLWRRERSSGAGRGGAWSELPGEHMGRQPCSPGR